MKYILRLIALPFVISLTVIGLVRHLFVVNYLFMRHGGEFIHYHKPKKTIADVYNVVANQVKP
jgi:hypothetical protein